jgi:conjugal transfer/entry exclusion protein
MEIDDNNKLKIHYLDVDKQIEKLQNQNKILVGTLQDIVNDRSPPWDKMDYQNKAREALKEVEDK